MNKANVRIVWNGKGGELDSVEVYDTNENSIRDALIKLLEGNIVTPGDTFVIEDIA